MAKTRIQQSRNVSPAEKAAAHQITGVGRNRVKRQFFGLSKSDEEAIRALVQKHIDKVVAKP